jgi:hypothetical protein
VTVTSAVKFLCFETIATAPPRKRTLLPSELCEDLWKVWNDLQIERRRRRTCDPFNSTFPD